MTVEAEAAVQEQHSRLSETEELVNGSNRARSGWSDDETCAQVAGATGTGSLRATPNNPVRFRGKEANDFDVKCVTCSRSSAVVSDLVTASFATNDARNMHNTSPNITSTNHRKCQVIAVTSCAVVVVVLMCGFMRECVAWHTEKLACRYPKRHREQHVPDSPLPSRYVLKVVHLKLSPRTLRSLFRPNSNSEAFRCVPADGSIQVLAFQSTSIADSLNDPFLSH